MRTLTRIGLATATVTAMVGLGGGTALAAPAKVDTATVQSPAEVSAQAYFIAATYTNFFTCLYWANWYTQQHGLLTNCIGPRNGIYYDLYVYY